MSNYGDRPSNVCRRTRKAAGRIGSSILRDQRGAAAVEIAIVLPLFLMVILGTLELGRALESRNDMSHALSRAVRVLNLDSETTPNAIAALLSTYLADRDAEALSVSVSSTTISEIDYMKISVNFPFEVRIPFSSLSTITLGVETVAPVISPTK
jgi:Flp pilus assembly protein TadG